MEIDDLENVRENLDSFLKRFDKCIKTSPSRKHMRTYISGQISSLERKSVEPIALEFGVAPRTLQEFLEFYKWDEEQVRLHLQEIVDQDYKSEQAIALLDETSYPKKGDKTACVSRQHCGARGKVDNCVVSVNLSYVIEGFHTLIDADLYLPEETWANNADRRKEAYIPEDLKYRPKWKIALDLLSRTIENKVHFKYLSADEFYGRSSEFRKGVDDLKLIYVVEVPCSTTGWTKRPEVVIPDSKKKQGRPFSKPRLAQGEKKLRRVDQLWERGCPSWENFHIKNTEKGPVVWKIRTTSFYSSEKCLPNKVERLIIAFNVLTKETKYFLSNAPEEVNITELLHVAFSRSCIEQDFQESKGQVGLDHFEVRNYRPVMRHLILSMVSLLFLMKETKRLREKKPLVESTASAHDCGSAA
jgi:SRSO17 transposase